MKNILKFSVISLTTVMILSGCASYRGMASPAVVYQDGGPHISFDVFYSTLSPFGRWMSYANYGQVWIPNVGNGFAPYSTNGHWVYTDYGWTWVSDYSWGWAPFHYGRWLYDNYYGWIWVPGSDWAPAWVAWRNSSDYYGWAPLGPGVNINISIGIPAARWIFVPRHYFGTSLAYRYYVPRARNTIIIHNTTVINNVNVYNDNRYYSGPSRGEVQTVTHRNIRPVRVFNSSNPGVARVNNNRLNIYRPTVERVASNDTRVNAPGGNNHAPAPVNNNNRPERVFNPQQSAGNRNTGFQNGFPQDNARPARTVQPAPNERVREQNQAPQQSNKPVRVLPPSERGTNSRVQNQPRAQSRPERTIKPNNTRVMHSERVQQRTRQEVRPTHTASRAAETRGNSRASVRSHSGRGR